MLLFCFSSVWSRPVHSEHQIRFAGCRHPPPPAAKQRASHHNVFPWKRDVSARPGLPHAGRALHLAAPWPANPADVHPQPELPRGRRHAANPRTRTKPHAPPPGAGSPPPLSHARGSAVTAGHASLRQPAGPQPHGAGQFLQPGQPRLVTRGLGQGVGEAQLCLTVGYINPTPSEDLKLSWAALVLADFLLNYRLQLLELCWSYLKCRKTCSPQPSCCQTCLLELWEKSYSLCVTTQR